jgi:phospholipid/cholesterol/gamma-HCH transport system substrate-binding protein
MELNFSRREKIVGMFVICIAVLLLTTVIVIGRGKDWFKKYVTYYTIFDEGYNLQVDTPVKLFNADIGKIKKIDLVGDSVKIKLIILEEFRSRINTSTKATVESPTLLGSEHIAIIPAKDDSPLIQEGGIIPSKKKKSIADYLEEFQIEKTAKMIIETAQGLTKIVQILQDPEGPLFTALGNLNKTLAHVEMITRGVQAGEGTVGGLLKSRSLWDQIRANLDEVGKSIENISRAAAKTPVTMDQVQDNLATLHEIEKGILDATGTLKTILANIEKGSYDVPKVTQSTSKGIQEIRNAVENINKAVQSLQQSFLIKPHLPPLPEGKNVDASLRP